MSSPALAQALWGETHMGMTVEAVRAVFPGVRLDPKPRKLKTSSVVLLRLDRHVIEGRQFRVQFYFDNGFLSQVTLMLGQAQTYEICEAAFDDFVKILRAEHGSETGEGGA